jgi:hypothetical protein
VTLASKCDHTLELDAFVEYVDAEDAENDLLTGG